MLDYAVEHVLLSTIFHEGFQQALLFLEQLFRTVKLDL